jgi:hypothetical protein
VELWGLGSPVKSLQILFSHSGGVFLFSGGGLAAAALFEYRSRGRIQFRGNIFSAVKSQNLVSILVLGGGRRWWRRWGR